MLAESGRPTSHLPTRRGGQPFAGAIAKRAPEFGMIDVGEAVAAQPVLVERALVRLAQRRPEQTRLLRVSPRHRVVAEGPNEAPDHLEDMSLAFVAL